MKKVYNKPEIMFENFSLSTNIASDCEVKTNLLSSGSCGYQPDRFNYIVFTTNTGSCTYKEDDGEYNGVCYHTPGEAKNLFNS